MNAYLGPSLLAWYQENKRDLPWRKTKDPYKIWLSEIILQQTRVAQGLSYYEKFVAAYPRVQDLANAPEDEVLRLWQGLGYYNRARNLQKAARFVVDSCDGQFPDSFETLKKLPGVGDYTAAAIASFAFHERVGVVDGNVLRVASRFHGLYDDIGKQSTRKNVQQLMDEEVYKVEPELFNQAIMEFGALQCVPKNPDCDVCPVLGDCMAHKTNAVSALPVKEKKVKVKDRFLSYFMLKDQESLLLKQRGVDGIWAKLFEFPCVESKNKSQQLNDIYQQQEKWALSEVEIVEKEYKHILSHQRLHVRFVMADLSAKEGTLIDYKSYSRQQVGELPKPVLIDKFLHDFYF